MGLQPSADSDLAPRSFSSLETPIPSSIDSAHGAITPNSFERLSVIGRGRFSQVYLARLVSTGEVFAMKTMKKKDLIEREQTHRVLTERKILERLQQATAIAPLTSTDPEVAVVGFPFIVPLRYALQDEARLYLILSFINGGELYHHLLQTPSHRFRESRVKFYAAEIFLALDFLHKNGIIYRDLKPENVLIDSEGHAVLADFNFSTLVPGSALANEVDIGPPKSICGTIDYVAPEVFHENTNSSGSGYGIGVDWWSFGVLLFELLVGKTPFYGEDTHRTYVNILNREVDLVVPAADLGLSDDCVDLLTRLLAKDPADRIGADEIRSHSWFVGGVEGGGRRPFTWDDVLKKRIVPEFVPEVTGPQDTSYVDSEFLSQYPFCESPAPISTHSTTTASASSSSSAMVSSSSSATAATTKKGIIGDLALTPSTTSSVLPASQQRKFDGFEYVAAASMSPDTPPLSPIHAHEDAKITRILPGSPPGSISSDSSSSNPGSIVGLRPRSKGSPHDSLEDSVTLSILGEDGKEVEVPNVRVGPRRCVSVFMCAIHFDEDGLMDECDEGVAEDLEDLRDFLSD